MQRQVIMARVVLAAILFLPSALCSIAQGANTSPTIVQAKPIPPDEPLGARPYEMVRANRRPPRVPLVSFDSLKGWTLECTGDANGALFESQRQRVWESPVARLVYRGTSPKSTVVLRPGQPIPIPDSITAATVWIYGNNWSWVPDPKTPQVTVSLLIRDGEGREHVLDIARVRWKEWWLVHKVIPKKVLAKAPLQLSGIRITGCANREDRELFFEDLGFFRESLKPLSFAPRPRRGVGPFPGQSPGANTGPGRLPFPTREETILPENLAPTFTTRLLCPGDATLYRFVYEGDDARLEYAISPGSAYWGPVTVKLDGVPVARAFVGAGPGFSKELQGLRLVHVTKKGDVLHGVWEGSSGQDKVVIESDVRLWQKSLVVDYICRGGFATELSYGRIKEVEKPELILLPYLNYGRQHLHVLMSRGHKPFFASVWMDWYRSNASRPYTEDKIEGETVKLNGGVRYMPRTDGKRNDLFERVFLTFSPTFEETLPSIPNPPAKRGREAGTRLWQESWGPGDYKREHERSKRLLAYGIAMLTQCNHEITWRDGGESFTFRTMAAPGKGGDEALRKYVQAQRSLGWRSGLYTNYCDFAPVNEFWNVAMVMRNSSGDLATAWPRCYSPKALFAVEMDRKLAPVIQKKFNTNAAYTDVHTSVAPWDRTDYDARIPGAGTFASTFYAYGELLLHDQDVYDGHCWSEGNHQWLYAGLCTGNYGLTYSELRLWEYPYLPHFDLLKMHPLSVDVGVPWTDRFFSGKKGWNKPENIESSIDQFIAATIAYGHIGWLVEERYGMRQTCRSYYMLQQLQSRYVMRKPEEIRYGSGSRTLSSSEAFLSGQWKMSRLFIPYPNSLEIWINGNDKEEWEVIRKGRSHILPPYGWLAIQSDEFYECSELRDGKRYDRVSSPDYVFIDGRGVFRSFDGIGTSGSIAVSRMKEGNGLSIIAIEGVEEIIITSTPGCAYTRGEARADATMMSPRILQGARSRADGARESSRRDAKTPSRIAESAIRNPKSEIAASPSRTFGLHDVRTQIARVAEATRVTGRAFDPDGKDLGTVPMSKTAAGWKLRAKQGALRYEIRID